jgi:hypothetical protein
MIEFSEAQRIGVGQFADVFQMQDASRVCKIYRALGSEKWREWAERINQQELRAYEIATATPALKDHTARCFGSASVSRVMSTSGDEISERYLLGTAIVLERLYGEEEKGAGLDPIQYPYIYELLDAFYAVGIDAGDASVFDYQAPKAAKFIDITTKYGARIVAEVI